MSKKPKINDKITKIKGEEKMNNIIEVKNLTKEYKDLKAIDDLSFEVRKRRNFRIASDQMEAESLQQ